MIILQPFANLHITRLPGAPRPARLNGLRPGILENSKPNAQLLMESWVEALSEQFDLAPVTIGHKAVTTPPSRATLDALASCDFVLVGTGDCGSCLAWTVRSALALEKRGVPTVCVGSDAFRHQFEVEAENCGMPDLRFVYVTHPLGGIREAAVREKARASIGSVVAALVAPGECPA